MNLTEEHLKQLDAFIQEMPTKFGLPLLNFLSKIAQEQNPNSPEVFEEN